MRIILSLFICSTPLLAQGTKADYERSQGIWQQYANKVYSDKIEPNWLNATQFWYRVDLPAGKKELKLVDIETGFHDVITDKKLEELKQKKPAVGTLRVPFFDDGTRSVPTTIMQIAQRPRRTGGTSPDGKWQINIVDNNVVMKDVKTNEETKLTTDGKTDNRYGRVIWAPDSSRFIVIRTKAGGDRKVTLVETSPKDQLQPKTSTYDYLKPGDPIPMDRPYLFDATTKKEIPVKNDALIENPWSLNDWHIPNGNEAYVLYNQRGHRVMRVMKLDLATGELTAVVREEPKTFVDYANKVFLRHFDATNQLIWMSERSGYNHLYLIDRKTGDAKPITKGDWLGRGVDNVDVEKKQITFRALGIHPKQDPYHIHYARVNFDGSGLTLLTDSDGTHTAPKYSPDGAHYTVSWSRVDQPVVTELRKTSDGSRVMTLATADISALTKAGWKPPERFVAKGRDGTTDIYGVIHRPSNFDSKKNYPVIEYIYAGPHSHFVPKAFRPVHYPQPMAELGFIVVQIDGMGTNWRSKAFHDVCWKNLGDSGFPDRIAWIKAAALKHPEMNLTRGVGIYGGSAGGQSSTRAVLAHGDFYTVAVSDCGCHDNRMDKIWWNELWMSYPVDKHYAEQSNVTNAHKLQGKLMLVVGELDKNVDPASTMQVSNALIKANKDFDLLIMPGVGHGAAEQPYASRRRADFFVRHLIGVEPRAK